MVSTLAAFAVVLLRGTSKKEVFEPENGKATPNEGSSPAVAEEGEVRDRLGAALAEQPLDSSEDRRGEARSRSQGTTSDDGRVVVAVGRVQVPAGVNVQGIEMLLINRDRLRTDRCSPGSDGEFKLHARAALRAGWTVHAGPIGQACTADVEGPFPDHSLSDEPRVCGLEVRECVTIHGVVVNSEDGRSLPGIRVVLHSVPSGFQTSHTDSRGVFEVRPESLYATLFLAAGDVRCDWSAKVIGPVDASTLHQRSPLRIELERCFAVQGILSREGWEPIEDSVVRLVSPETYLYGSAPRDDSVRTDEAGRFQMRVATDYGWIHVEGDARHAPVLQEWSTINHRALTVNAGPRLVVRATVRSSFGDRPIREARVSIRPFVDLDPQGRHLRHPLGEDFDQTETDRRGMLRLTLAVSTPESGWVEVIAEGFHTFEKRFAEVFHPQGIPGQYYGEIALDPWD